MANLKSANYETPKIENTNNIQPKVIGVFTIPIFVAGVVYVAGITLAAAAVGGAVSVQLALHLANFVKK